MADIDGNYVDIGPQTFSGKIANVRGIIVDFSAGAGAALTFRMRATDTTLGQVVFWASNNVDAAGADYTGPGPLTDVVVHTELGATP